METTTKDALSLDELIGLARMVDPDNWNKHTYKRKRFIGGIKEENRDTIEEQIESYIGTLPGLIAVKVDLKLGYGGFNLRERNVYSITATKSMDIELGSRNSFNLDNPIKSLYQEIKTLYESRIETKREEALRKARELIQ